MPTLKGIDCTIELADEPLTEHHTRYRDKYVECHIATPNTDHSFSIHATSSEYIADGLAVFVFIDGDYQCNRNLPMPTQPSGRKASSTALTAEFRLRQKEEKLSDGSFVGREWSFAHLVTAQEDAKRNRHYEENVGKIEVVFLRCLHNDSAPASGSKGAAQNVVAEATQAPQRKAPTVKTVPAKVDSVEAVSNAATASGMMGIGFDLFGDGSNDPLPPSKAMSSRSVSNDNSTLGTNILDMMHSDYSNIDQLDGSREDRVYRYNRDGYYENLYRPNREPRHDAPQRVWHGEVYREWEPPSSDYGRHPDTIRRRPDQRAQSKAGQIAYVLEEKRALKAIGFDTDGLIKLIGKDKKVSSIDLARMSPEQIQYLLKATKKMSRNESDDSSNSSDSTDSSESSESTESSKDHNNSPEKCKKRSKKSSKKSSEKSSNAKADTTAGTGWGAQPNMNDKSSRKRSKKSRKSKDNKKETQQSSESSTSDDKDDKAPSTNSKSVGAVINENAWGPTQQEEAPPQQPGFTPASVDKSEQGAKEEQQAQSGTRSHAHHSHQSSRKSDVSTPNPRYWSTWDKRTDGRAPTGLRHGPPQKARSPYIYAAPALPAVNVASKLDTDCAVKVGRGAAYGHKSARPEYIDTMESPYAVFTFKYCSREKLEQILHRSIKDDSIEVVQKVERQRLLNMPKEALAEELMKLKVAGALPQGQAVAASSQKASSKRGSVVDSQAWGMAKDKGSAAEKAKTPTGTKAQAGGFTPAAVGASGPGGAEW